MPLPMVILGWFIGICTGYVVGSCKERSAARLGLVAMAFFALVLMIGTWGK